MMLKICSWTSNVVPAEAQSIEDNEQRQTSEPAPVKERRSWRAPVFSTLEVNATEQLTPTGSGHCWSSWKCS
jgi:hypothetical protein